MENIAQVFILILGGSSIWCLARKEEWRKMGFILGFLAQPFWIYVSIVNQQWGILLVSCLYTYTWGMGVYNHVITRSI